MLLIPTLLVLFLVVRGTPVLLYRHDIPKRERLPFGLFASVASLGLVVVITQIGLRAQNMNAAIAQALMGAALLSSLVYPDARPGPVVQNRAPAGFDRTLGDSWVTVTVLLAPMFLVGLVARWRKTVGRDCVTT